MAGMELGEEVKHGSSDAGEMKAIGKEKVGRKKKRGRGLKKGPRCEVEGSICKKKKEGEGGCKVQGVRRKRVRAGIRVLEARWAWTGFGLLSRNSQNILFSFAKQFWQLIFKNGDDCLDKTFSGNFRKIK